ncbi:uncharacterized protein At4g00950 isoform X1 [Lotus japonicus]|uniref:uncharacterized protein At4g00950 isoform X1 n=1 Tax=Lotus japonicus TaxID=34305 RepID=UPI0025904090|nr:uncharacterized protein At4g00950 isoform X1 [Lotus japonicus]
MGSEAEHEQSSMLKLTLFSVPATQMQSPERSGMLTPPINTSAAVPFRWEQEPGKPKLCNALITFDNKCLVLPPRLLTPSPYVASTRFRSPSFKMSKGYNCYGSSFSADNKGLLGPMVLVKDTDRWFGSWRKKAFKVKREVAGGSHVFPSSDATADTHNKLIKCSGSTSSSSLPHGKSRFWTSIREGMKQVVPSWRSKKLKKDGSALRL